MLKQKLTGEGVATMTVSGQAEVFFADQSRDVHLIYLEGDASASTAATSSPTTPRSTWTSTWSAAPG